MFSWSARALGARPAAIVIALACLAAGTGEQRATRRDATQAWTADALIARVSESRQGLRFRGTARIVHSDSAAGVSRTIHLSVKARLDGRTATVIYAVAGPAAERRQVLLVVLEPGRAPQGFLAQAAGRHPPTAASRGGAQRPTSAGDITVTPLDARVLTEPFLETVLTIGDLTDEVLAWPFPRIAGSDTVLDRACTLVEWPAASSGGSGTARARACISPDLRLPLRFEHLGVDGTLRRRLTVRRVTKVDATHWTASSVLIAAGDGRSRTLVDVVRGERNADVPAAEFSLEAIEAELRSKPGAAR